MLPSAAAGCGRRCAWRASSGVFSSTLWATTSAPCRQKKMEHEPAGRRDWAQPLSCTAACVANMPLGRTRAERVAHDGKRELELVKGGRGGKGGEGGEGGRDAALAHRDVDDTLEQRVDLQVPAAPVQRPPLEPRRLPAASRLHLDYISATSRLHLGYISARSRLDLGAPKTRAASASLRVFASTRQRCQRTASRGNLRRAQDWIVKAVDRVVVLQQDNKSTERVEEGEEEVEQRGAGDIVDDPHQDGDGCARQASPKPERTDGWRAESSPWPVAHL